MFQSLLVPLDGSAFGEHALPLALTIARRARAAVTLVHVHQPLVYSEGLPPARADLDAKIQSQAEAYLLDVTRRLQAAAGDIRMSAVFLKGPTAETIVHHAADARAGLIVMASHGRGPLTRFWIGSVADELIRRAVIPVLLVRPGEGKPNLAQEQLLSHVLLPLDGSAFTEKILPPALALGKLMQAQYTLLHAVPPAIAGGYDIAGYAFTGAEAELTKRMQAQAQEYLDRTAERLRRQALQVQTCVAIDQAPAEAILKEAALHRNTLTALATQGRSGLSRLLLGSVEDKVLRGAAAPILLYRPQE